MKERCDVGVTVVALVPHSGPAARAQIRGYGSRLPVARRGRQPDQSIGLLIEPAEQSLSRKALRHRGHRDLGERRPAWHDLSTRIAIRLRLSLNWAHERAPPVFYGRKRPPAPPINVTH